MCSRRSRTGRNFEFFAASDIFEVPTALTTLTSRVCARTRARENIEEFGLGATGGALEVLTAWHGATTTAAGRLRTKPPLWVRPAQAEARWRHRISPR